MIKTMTFAILHFSVAFTVAYLLTGSLLIGGIMALIEPAINTLVFYMHEKAWLNYARQHNNQHESKHEIDEHQYAFNWQ